MSCSFEREPDRDSAEQDIVGLRTQREKRRGGCAAALLCTVLSTVLCARPHFVFRKTSALLHGQRREAGNAVQSRGDVRCSLSGGVRDPSASHYGNRGIRRRPLRIRCHDLRSRIAERHRGREGLRQAEDDSAVRRCDRHKLGSCRGNDHRSDTADAARCGGNVHGSRRKSSYNSLASNAGDVSGDSRIIADGGDGRTSRGPLD